MEQDEWREALDDVSALRDTYDLAEPDDSGGED
jgi:hypothetical protein